jgi:hypothetical protein
MKRFSSYRYNGEATEAWAEALPKPPGTFKKNE